MALRFGSPRQIGAPDIGAMGGPGELIRRACRNDFGQFIREFFPEHFWGDFSKMHQDVIALEKTPDRRGVLEATAAPRGNAKTVFRVLAKVIHSIVYGYHPFTVIIGYSAGEATGKVKDIRDELLFNEKLIEVYGPQLDRKAGVEQFVTLNDCMVMARGRGGQVRGLRHGKYRPTHIICDDVEDLEHVQSPVQRQKTMHWFTKDVMPSIQSGDFEKMMERLDQDEDGEIEAQPERTPGAYEGCITFVGTVLHEDSLLANLLKDPSWTRQKYRSVIKWSDRPDLWDQWRGIYCDLDREKPARDAWQFYRQNETEMLAGTQVLWPAGESYYKLMVQRIKMGEAAFSSEKQNEPFDPESQVLDPSVLHRFTIYRPTDPEWPESLGDDGYAIVRHDGKAIHYKDLKVIAFYDPAVGRKSKTAAKMAKKDFGAIVVVGQDQAGWIYVLDAWLQKKPPNEQIEACFNLHSLWGYDSLYIETVAFQELLKTHFEEEKKRRGRQIRVIGVDQYTDKQARITSLQPYFSTKVLMLANNLNPEFENQLRLFPTADHDDGPDALQGAVSKLRKPIGFISVLDKRQGIM